MRQRFERSGLTMERYVTEMANLEADAQFQRAVSSERDQCATMLQDLPVSGETRPGTDLPEGRWEAKLVGASEGSLSFIVTDGLITSAEAELKGVSFPLVGRLDANARLTLAGKHGGYRLRLSGRFDSKGSVWKVSGKWEAELSHKAQKGRWSGGPS